MPALVGYDNFVRTNPKTDAFDVVAFHHVEIFCGDAQTTAARWSAALGLDPVARADPKTTGAAVASLVLGTGRVRFVFTSPTSVVDTVPASIPTLTLSPLAMHDFHRRHGLAVFAVGIRVADARDAFDKAVASGARPHASPRAVGGDGKVAGCVVSEVLLHADGDAVLRFVSGPAVDSDPSGFLPGFTAEDAQLQGADAPRPGYGFDRFDHVVSNVAELIPAVDYVMKATGFHEFAEFTADDVGTPLSGLNSMVLASNNELVLLPFNEPTTGGKRKSQIQTYLDQHGGPGVQHIAIKSSDIFRTVRAMRAACVARCGFRLMDRPRPQYYKQLRERLGDDAITEEQAHLCEELGILADRDDQGVLLQIFTKPVGDRATLFLEIIQRIGCDEGGTQEQVGGCGGFGKGNFHELFRAIEEYETKAGINAI